MTYLLCIYLSKKQTITIGKLGRFHFEKGNYVYVGSAKKNMEKRIIRHLRKKKKKFWHIDYLLGFARIKKVWTCHLPEEKVAEILSNELKIPVVEFGSSDTKSKSHFFYGTISTKFLKYLTPFLDSI